MTKEKNSEKIQELERKNERLKEQIKQSQIKLDNIKKRALDQEQPLTHIQLMHHKDKLNQLKLNKFQLKSVLARQTGYRLLEALPDSKNRYKYSAITQCCYSITWRTDEYKSAKYCGQRFCHVCGSIKMGRMMNHYKTPLAKLGNLYFLTLTVQTIAKEGLPNRINEMQKHFSRIVKNNTEQKRKHKSNPSKYVPPFELSGLRKMELIVAKNNKYHCHYHIIMNSREGATHLIEKWVSRWNKESRLASFKAQDIKPVTDLEKGLQDLTKYVSKPIHKEDGKNKLGVEIKVTPENLDWILTCLYKKVTFKPFGKLKKSNEKYIPTGQAAIEKPSRLDSNEYMWQIQNWYSTSTKQALGLARPNLSKEDKEQLKTSWDTNIENHKSLQAKLDKKTKK